ncbi:MAG: hypothetical protein AAFX05_05190 [Planctomycetota bacterium]
MSQMGMQMPGRRRQTTATPNVYTGLLLASVAALATAVVFVALAGMKIGPGGDVMGAFKIHPPDARLELKDP